MRSALLWVGLTVLRFAIPSQAQDSTQDELDELLSVAISVLPDVTSAAVQLYTELTSFLANPTTAPTSTPSGSFITATSLSSTPTATSEPSSESSFQSSETSQSSFESSSQSSETTSQSSSRTSSRNTLPAVTRTSSPTLAVAVSPTSTSPPITEKKKHSNTLAIALGTVLGILLLAAIALIIFLILRRRNHKRYPGGDEMERSALKGNGRTPDTSGSLLAAGAIDHEKPRPTTASSNDPNIAEHPALRDNTQNPFVPVPPPPRRTVPGARSEGIRDEGFGNHTSVVGGPQAIKPGSGTTNPFSPQRSGYAALNSQDTPHGAGRSGIGEALAAGAGGAAVGAMAANGHNKNKQPEHTTDRYSRRYSNPRGSVIRKPLPSHPATTDETQAAHLGLDESSAALLGGGNVGNNQVRQQSGRAWWKEPGSTPSDLGHSGHLTPPDVPSRSPRRFSFQEDEREGQNSAETLLTRSSGASASPNNAQGATAIAGNPRGSNAPSPAAPSSSSRNSWQRPPGRGSNPPPAPSSNLGGPGPGRPGHSRQPSLGDLVEEERLLEERRRRNQRRTNPWDPTGFEYHHLGGRHM